MTMTSMLMVCCFMLTATYVVSYWQLCMTVAHETFIFFEAVSRKGKMRVDAKEGKAKDVSVRLPPLLARVNETLLVGGLDFGKSLWCCDVCIARYL